MALFRKTTIKTLIRKQSFKLAIILWCLFVINVISFVVMHPGKHTVTPAYWNASINWIKGNNFYQFTGGFVYLPQSAILQIPFALLPFPIAEIIWRILNITLYAISCYLISSLFISRPNRQMAFLLISAFAIPLAYSSAQNGQANLTIASLLGIIVFLMTHEKYTESIFVCFFGLAIKPYMAIPLLLIYCLFPKRCFLAMIFGSIILFIFPFFFQAHDYVWFQYIECLRTFKGCALFGQQGNYAYFFGMLKEFGLKTSFSLQIIFTLLFGFLVFLYSFSISKKYPIKESSIIIVTFATIFILLFSPRTEINTYCLIGSFFSYFFIKSFSLISRSRVTHALILLSCYVAMLESYELGMILTPGKYQWLAPLGLTIFTCYILFVILPKIGRVSKIETTLA